MDVSVPSTGARLMWDGTPPVYPFTGYSGRGTKIGIIGPGIDVLHPDLISDGPFTRIQYLWDQDLPLGPTPQTYCQNNSGAGQSIMTYGSMYGQTEINSFIQGFTQLFSHTEDIKGPLAGAGWGTGMASIAAGNGRAASGAGFPAYKYVGMAPNAKLLIVKLASTQTMIGGNMMRYVLDALRWMRERCEATGTWNCIALVPTLDFGGPNDGTAYLDTLIDAMIVNDPANVDAWKQFWVVSSSGYMAGLNRKAERSTTNQNATADFVVTVPDYTAPTITATSEPEGIMTELVWGVGPGNDATQDYEITVLGPSTNPLISNIAEDSSQQVNTAEGSIYVANYGRNVGYGGGTVKAFVYLHRYNNADPKIAAGDWTIRIKQKHTTGTAVRVDARITKYSAAIRGGSGEKPEFKSSGGLVNTRLITSPASATRSLSCGAYATKTTWTDYTGTPQTVSGSTLHAILPSSSIGYRRDGAVRPHLSAPGTCIAARGRFDTVSNVSGPYWLQNTILHRMYVGPMAAAAHFAGALALWQEWYNINVVDPYPAIADVQAAFQARAVADTFTGATPNITYGYGKLNCAFNTSPAGGIEPTLGGDSGGGDNEVPDDVPPISQANP